MQPLHNNRHTDSKRIGYLALNNAKLSQWLPLQLAASVALVIAVQAGRAIRAQLLAAPPAARQLNPLFKVRAL
jgi:hypothetical protein